MALRPLLILLAFLAGACTPRAEFVPRPASPQAKTGGTLVVAITEPGSIEPTNAYEPSGALVVSTLCDSLVAFDPGTGDPLPAIAESWQVSDSGMRITVKLRKGVMFHDGTELTAEDAVYSLSRVARYDYASQVAGLLEPISGFREVHGEAEEVEDERFRETLRGLRVIEIYSFEILLSEPRADFIGVLGHPLAAPIPKRLAEEDPDAFARMPVCAGPYRMTRPWTPGDQSIRVERFDGYYAQNAAFTRGGTGYADAVEFRVVPSNDAGVREFGAGTVHVARVPPEGIAGARAQGERLVETPGATLEFIGLPTTVEPFRSREVRIALSRALDRRLISAELYGGRRTPASGVLPPSLGRIHREGACGPNAPEVSDPKGARRALADANLDLSGRTVSFAFNNEFDNAALVQAVAGQWRANLGLEVEPVPMGWEAYLAAGRGSGGFTGPFRLGWSAPYPSADAFLAPLFGSQGIGVDNLARFRSRAFDRDLERKARRATNEEDRRRAYQDLEDLICAEMPVIPVAFATRAHLVATDTIGSASGSFTAITDGAPLLRELFVK